MSIWHAPVSLDDVRKTFGGGLALHLGMQLTAIGDDWLAGTMPVDERTYQPMGLLHGGASVSLAETLGSVAANLCVDFPTVRCVGQEINANHLRSLTSGHVLGTARPVHIGGRTHVWQIEIRDPVERLICISRLTIAVLAPL